jgi:cardiolipin synthase
VARWGGRSPRTHGALAPVECQNISTPLTGCPVNACPLPDGVSGVHVFVEPGAGEKPEVQAIATATRSIWVEVYLLTDLAVVHALEEAANRHVDVRVLLEVHPFGGGDISAQKTLDTLNPAGVKAKAADPAFTFTHAKTILIDQATHYILTCNLTRSGLGGSVAQTNRDFGVIETNARDVAEATHIFLADWDRTRYQPAASHLLISPGNARAGILGMINGAQKTLSIEDEEMYDRASEDALLAAARRGVDVELLLPMPNADGSVAWVKDVPRLMAGGVHVRYLGAPYVHAKFILADSGLAFVGSQNFSATSLDQNREVGVAIADTAALHLLADTFEGDWAVSEAA